MWNLFLLCQALLLASGLGVPCWQYPWLWLSGFRSVSTRCTGVPCWQYPWLWLSGFRSVSTTVQEYPAGNIHDCGQRKEAVAFRDQVSEYTLCSCSLSIVHPPDNVEGCGFQVSGLWVHSAHRTPLLAVPIYPWLWFTWSRSVSILYTVKAYSFGSIHGCGIHSSV